MKKLVSITLALILAAGITGIANAAPEWVQLTRDAKSGQLPQMTMSQTRNANVEVIEVTVPGFYREAKRAGEGDAIFVTTGLSSRHMEKGMPELPTMKALVKLPDDANVDVSVVSEEWTNVKLDKVAPSRGHITRNVDPETVNYTYSDFYKSAKTFPGDDKKVVVSAPFMMRDVRGVEVTVNPFQYDNAKKNLKIAKKIKLELRYNGASKRSEKKAVPYEFAQIYRSAFLNFAPNTEVSRLEIGNMLVISADQFAEEMTPFVEWKKKQGFNVKVAKMSEVGKTGDDVYKYIQNEYNTNNIAYIVLAGDAEFVPTLLGVKERAASDPCYTKLAGNDHVPDAIISRLSAKTPVDIKNQVAKIVHYEQFPDKGADASWYRKAMGIASAEGSPADYDRSNWLRDGLMKFRFDSVDQIYDPRASKADVSKFVNEGRSVINYIGHGSKTAWVTTNFGNNEALALKNDRKLPVIWSVACVNGAFKDGSDCFCEAWMKAGSAEAPAGAAAIFGSSTNAEWVPPCDMQSEINLVQMCGEKQASVGALALTGVLKAMQTWGTDAKSSGVMLFEQYNIFGDCTMLTRNDVPKEVAFKAAKADKGVTFNVTAEGKAVKNARVAVTMGENGEAKAGVTDENGNVTLTFENGSNAGLVTITGQNLVPVVDSSVSL